MEGEQLEATDTDYSFLYFIINGAKLMEKIRLVCFVVFFKG
jgi:hypothetical protein